MNDQGRYSRRTAVRGRTAGRLAVLAVLALASTMACDAGKSTGPDRTGASRPDDARFFTEDIPRFWLAFDRMAVATDTMPLRRDYLDAGTVGLRDFTSARWKNASTLAAMVWPRREYYRSIRENTLAVANMADQLRAVFRAFDGMLDGGIYPDVYFVVGGLGTGGTTSRRGLLIGVELFCAAPDSPRNVLTPWQQSVIRSIDVLPAIVAHELTHFNQHPASLRTLLEQALHEGSADFVGELLTGRSINEHIVAWADPREAEVWHEFSAAMNGTDISRWLYNGGSADSTRPADLGYYVGYRITKAYYDRQSDKRAALREILNIRDARQFLAASGYGLTD